MEFLYLSEDVWLMCILVWRDFYHLAIWNQALDPNEILDISNLALNIDFTNNEYNYTNSEGLIRYWKFNEGSGDILYDHSVNADHCLVVSGTWIEEPANKIHLSKLLEIFKSKNEAYKWMAGEGEVFLPDKEKVSMYDFYFYN